jgi:spore photoproduct lyase
MWREPGLPDQWSELERKLEGNGKPVKKILLQKLKDRWHSLKNRRTVYKSDKLSTRLSVSSGRKVTVRNSDSTVFGWCPVAFEKTVCCNLRTVDAVQGCGFGCSYCSIQTFYDSEHITVDANLHEKLQSVVLDPQKRYHIGSGQSSDSLFLGNKNGILDAQFDFARNNPNVILELKTKSKNIAYLLEADVPENVFVSWSLNPQIVIKNEEHLTASENDRLEAARAVADRNISIGFHFHPMVFYRGWKDDYEQLIGKVLSTFSPDEVALVSFGTLTFIKPAINNLRLKGLESKVLQIPMEDAAGKLSYPFQIKEEMFTVAWEAFRPWRDHVFFYFCMEERKLWESVFGYCYKENEEFGKALCEEVFRKLNSRVKNSPIG